MAWEHALRLWRPPPEPDSAEARVASERRAQLAVVRSASLCVASGKGGTGKSVLTAGLAELFAARGRTLLIDADMGVGNAHILQDQSPPRSFVDVVARRCSVGAARARCSDNLDLVGGGSGVSQMSALGPREMAAIAHGLAEIEGEYDYVLVDSAAGISEQTIAFAAACDAVLVVTTPDITAMTDAYAFIKVLHACRKDVVPLLLVNRVAAEDGPDHDGRHVAERIERVCAKFLGLAPPCIGSIPDDRAVARSVAARRNVVRFDARTAASVALQAAAANLAERLPKLARGGVGNRLMRALERR